MGWELEKLAADEGPPRVRVPPALNSETKARDRNETLLGTYVSHMDIAWLFTCCES